MIPNPTMIAVSLVAAIALFVSGFGTGIKWENGRNAEAKEKAGRQYTEQLQKEVNRGNELARQVELSKQIIGHRTVSVLRRVPDVTTGRDCLSSSAVRLFNDSATTSLPDAAGKPAGESTAEPAATDRDVEEWAINAQDQYGKCAAQLNGLIDYSTPSSRISAESESTAD